MSKKSRTFTDIDMNFGVNPIALDKVDAEGTISASSSSHTITGTGTSFSSKWIYRNIYVGTTLCGKVKSVESSTSLTLYTNCELTLSNQPFKWSAPADLNKKYDDNAIKASVKNLVMTSNFERPFHSEIGSQLPALLFEPASPITALLIQKAITQTIINYEPRVIVNEVSVKFSPDNNSVYATIQYTIVNTSTPQTVNLTLQRSR